MEERFGHTIHGAPRVGPKESHIRRSSLGIGRGRPGRSDPGAPTCFLSSALGLYVPSSLRFFLSTHMTITSARLSSDATVAVAVGNHMDGVRGSILPVDVKTTVNEQVNMVTDQCQALYIS